METTLNKIRKYDPCHEGWTTLLKSLGKTKSDDEPLSIMYILESNGLDDAIWCLRAVDGYEKEIRLFAVYCARQVQHLMKDERSVKAIDVSERFAKGTATVAQLKKAEAGAIAAWYEANEENGSWGAILVSGSAAMIAVKAISGDIEATAWEVAWALEEETLEGKNPESATRAQREAREVQKQELIRIIKT